MAKYEINVYKIQEREDDSKYPDRSEIYSQIYESASEKPLEKIIKAVNEIE